MSVPAPPSSSRAYVPGHSDHERARLARQGEHYAPTTRLFLRAAGLGPGMRVLDFGCGVGDVTLLAAEIVGGGGEVVGVDRSAVALAEATARAAGRPNVRFVEGDEDAAPEGPFDAVVGRLVLMYQPDPVATVLRLSRRVRPGGLVYFEETSLGSGGVTVPASPLFERCWAWAQAVCQRAGVRMDMGLRLHDVFGGAGLADATVTMFGRVSPGDDAVACALVSDAIRTLLPAMERLGVATAAEVDVDSLGERLRAEVAAGGGAIVPAFHCAGWAVRR